MAFDGSSKVEEAAWWVRQLHSFARDVGAVVPDTFPACARVFHPIEDGRERRTWAGVAAKNARIVHAETQLHDSPTVTRVSVPQRSHLLLRGPLGDIDALFDRLGHQSPNVWWPDDRAWFVATEIDLAWTYVAGSAPAVDAVLADGGLEALPAGPTDHFTYDLAALLRGYPVGAETCELAGYGPVAVSALRDLIDTGDPFLAAVVTKGEEVDLLALG